MWPKRKILVLIPRGAEEGLGFQAMLDTLQIEHIVREVSAESQLDLSNLTIPGVDGETEDFLDNGPTEIVYWPEIEEKNGYRQWGLTRGLTQVQLQDFLHSLWEREVILPVSINAQEEGKPLLWKLLAEAGYEPSLIWAGPDGQWRAERSRGLHWVVPEAWLNSLFKEKRVGREPGCWFPEAYWVLREGEVDFYSEQETFRYFGTLQRYPEPETENRIYESILQALQLGVTWWEVKKNLRWNVNVVERDRGTNGAVCSVEDVEYLEDRWSG